MLLGLLWRCCHLPADAGGLEHCCAGKLEAMGSLDYKRVGAGSVSRPCPGALCMNRDNDRSL